MPQVEAISALEPQMQKLTDAELRARTDEFRQRIQQRLSRFETEGTDPTAEVEVDAEVAAEPDPDRRKRLEKERYDTLQEVLNEILPEAFAVVREAGRRVLNMRHFDVQLIGGMVLHQGTISEMKTGEGKTLVATLPVYLNALSGRGVHVVTVNDYLAKRDSEWMGKLYRFLGLTVGVIVHDLDDEERRAAYAADVTYGTNNEFGFDYLRDNMKFDLKDCVQRGHNYAIVDEVDSILIDEARTPLIISGASEESTDKYYKVNRIIPKLEKGEEGRGDRGASGRARATHRRFRGRREAPQHHRHRRRLGKGRTAAGHRQHCRPGELAAQASRRNRYQGPCPIPPRRGVRHQGR